MPEPYRKYGNKKTNGCDSGREARRYQELLILERAVCYIADYVYREVRTRSLVVEDSKGVRTEDYIIKRKLMLQVHGIRILET